MSGLGKIVRAGVSRRRVQTAVMALTTLLAVTASVIAAGLLVASSAPFQHAFERWRGAHLTAEFDASKVTAQQLADTSHAAGVTAAAGPFATVTLRPRTVAGHTHAGSPPGVDLPPITIAARADPGGDVDRLDITRGRWATGSDEIVWAERDAPFEIGDRVAFPEAPGAPTLTVLVGRSAQRADGRMIDPAVARFARHVLDGWGSELRARRGHRWTVTRMNRPARQRQSSRDLAGRSWPGSREHDGCAPAWDQVAAARESGG